MRNEKEEEEVNKLRIKKEAIAEDLRIKKIEDELAEKKRIDAGWRTIASVWWEIPTKRDGCSVASSRIIKFHPSARNIDCKCDYTPAKFLTTSMSACELTWQRNSLLEGGKPLHTTFVDMDTTKNQLKGSEGLDSKEK